MTNLISGNQNPEITTSEQKKFFGAVVNINNESLLEIRCISQGNHSIRQFFSDTGRACEYILNLKNSNNIYFGIASRKDNTSGEKANCKTLSALFIDIDCGKEGHKKDSIFKTKIEALQFIRRFGFLKPSIIVDSGNGYHLYWLLDQAVSLEESQIKFLEKAMKNLSAMYGGDSTHDVSRIFRIPFTKNIKSETIKECVIVEADYKRKYSLILLTNHPLMKIDFNAIRSANGKHDYHKLLFGNIEGFETDDRSAIEQSLITYLTKNGYDDEAINLIFKNYGITGKFSEHSSPQRYLDHSITNAREFIENEHAKSLDYDVEFETAKYKILQDEKLFGYHRFDSEGELNRLSNFIIEFNPRTQMKRNDETLSYYSGKIIFTNKIYPFEKFESTLLVDSSGFNKFIANHTGTEGEIFKTSFTLGAIKEFNRTVGVKYEREYGYTPDLDKFITETMIVSKDKILLENTPIKNKEYLNNAELKLIDDPASAELAREGLLKILNQWDKPEKIYPIAAFSFLPLVHPLIWDLCPKKFYMLIQGTSGSGKTVTATWFQRFYGKILNLPPWNSTYTALNQIGSAYKDSLFIIDDLKLQNFTSEKDLRQGSALLQNYADNNSRHRSYKSLRLMDEYKIEGHLMLTGEDIVFTEASTIARGIVVSVDSKPTNVALVNFLNEQSKHFPALTLQYIQYILNSYSKSKMAEIFNKCRSIIDNIYTTSNDNLDINNYDREANNFALLLTSWTILKSFLWKNNISSKEFIEKDFNDFFKELMSTNLSLVKELRSDDLFENLLWSYIESGRLHLSSIDKNGREEMRDDRLTYIGYYHINNENKVTLIISLVNAFKEIKRINPELGISQSTLVRKLEYENKIEKSVKNNKWNINGKQVRGVRWIGKIPESIFNIHETEKVPNSAVESIELDKQLLPPLECNQIVKVPESDYSDLESADYTITLTEPPGAPNLIELHKIYEEPNLNDKN